MNASSTLPMHRWLTISGLALTGAFSVAIAQDSTTMRPATTQVPTTTTAPVQATRPMPPGRAPQIEGLEVLRSIGTYTGELRSYGVAPPTQAQIQDIKALSELLAKGANVKFEPVERDANDTRVVMHGETDPSASFEYDERTGGFLFNGGLNSYRNEGSTPNLPSEAQAVELAKRQLAELKLQPAAEELVVAHVGGLNMGVTDGKGNTKIFEKLRNVRFSRKLGGLPVEGATRILVQMGSQGSVAGLIYQWPVVRPGEPETRESLAAADDLRGKATAMIKRASVGALRSKVTKADLILFDDGRGRIEPAYHIVVEQYFDFKPGTKTMNPYDFYLPALRNSRAYFTVMQRAPRAPGQDAQTHH